MLIRTTIPFIAVLLFVASCDVNSSNDAMKLSKQIISVNDSLLLYGKTWSGELQIASGNKDFSQLQPVRLEMNDYLQRKIFELQTMQDIGGSENLRKAELDLLNFDKDSILPRFTVFEGYDTNTSDEQIMRTYSEMFSVLSHEGPMLKTVHDLLDDYAEANDFPKPIDKSIPNYVPPIQRQDSASAAK